MIWAALSGVPCLRSWPLIANTLSLFLSFPSLAAKPPERRSRMKTPLSSDLRMSLMPSGSERWLFMSVTCRTVPGWLKVELPWGLVEDWEATGPVLDETWWSDRASLILKPFSCITVSLRRDGCRSTTMALVWGTEARLTSFTWKHNTGPRRHSSYQCIETHVDKSPLFCTTLLYVHVPVGIDSLTYLLCRILTAFVYLRP